LSVMLAILLGIVQGITEFLPISSSGHLSVLQNIFKVDYSEEEHLLFDVMLHLGTLIAVCIIYRKDIVLMFKAGSRLMQGNMNFSAFGDPMIPPARQLLFVIVEPFLSLLCLFSTMQRRCCLQWRALLALPLLQTVLCFMRWISS